MKKLIQVKDEDLQKIEELKKELGQKTMIGVIRTLIMLHNMKK